MNLAQLTNLWFVRDPLNAVPAAYYVFAYLWVPGSLLAGWYAARWVRTGLPGQQLRAFLFVITVLLLLRWGLDEQYPLYPFALLVADVYTRHPQRRSFFYFLVVLGSGYLLVNNVLGIWFASPVSSQAFATVQTFDNSAEGGALRFDLLAVFAVLMTVSLVQLAWVLVHDQDAPRPWLLPKWPLRAPPTVAAESFGGDP